MKTQLNTFDGDARGRLAGLLLQRNAELLPRVAYYYRELSRRPRRWRRLLRRKLALTVTGAALLLALAGGPIARAEPIDTNATIAVVNGEVAISANGKCSLMEAIINARAIRAGQLQADCTAGNLSGVDTVSLPSGGEFVLTAPHNTQFGPTGLPVITTGVIINGNGATIRRSDVSGTPKFRILAVDKDGSLTVRNTTISNGQGDYYVHGGGIYSKGVLTIENSTISSNRADYGGGVYAKSATITGSRILDNEARGYYGGYGGGLDVNQLTLVNSIVAGNIAWGGEEWADLGGGFGGGVNMNHGTIIGSTISGNMATDGWDSMNYGIPVPGVGGGVWASGNVTIANSTISGNEANYGGGVYIGGVGNVSLVHTTVTGNHAEVDTEGSHGYYDSTGGKGGGIFLNVLYHFDESSCGTTTLRGVILSGNSTDDTGREMWVDGASSSCTPTVNANAFNLFGRSGNSGVIGFTPGANDIIPTVGLNAILSPLADNGGPTQTHALPANSPALDVAPNASCTAAPVNGVDQRGQPRNANGKGGASANECDAGSFELQPGGGGGGAFLISPTGSGKVGGVSFVPSDILKFDPAAGWSMYFDGSDVGVTKNLSAFEVLDNGDILMSFAANQPIPGVGTFAPQDIARFVPTATGNNTAGSFQWQLDGSAFWLTTSGEKIDALALNPDGRVAISTVGAAVVTRPEGGTLKAQDEDALGFNFTLQRWSALFDGTPITGLSAEDVNAMWINPTTGEIYISIVGAFNLGGVKGNGRDIVKLTPSGAPGGYTPSLWWDGSAQGFPTNIDGLEILP